MIPYADFLYFGILLYIALPTLLIRRWLGFSRAWVLLATAAMLPRSVRDHRPRPADQWSRELCAHRRLIRLRRARGCPNDLRGAGLRHLPTWIVAQVFLWMRTRTAWYWPFPAALLLTLFPLVGLDSCHWPSQARNSGSLGISRTSRSVAWTSSSAYETV